MGDEGTYPIMEVDDSVNYAAGGGEVKMCVCVVEVLRYEKWWGWNSLGRQGRDKYCIRPCHPALVRLPSLDLNNHLAGHSTPHHPSLMT